MVNCGRYYGKIHKFLVSDKKVLYSDSIRKSNSYRIYVSHRTKIFKKPFIVDLCAIYK